MKKIFILLLVLLPFIINAQIRDTFGNADTINPCSDKIYEKVEQMPYYTGGLEKILKVMNDSTDLDKSVNGKVAFLLIINCKGQVAQITVFRSMNREINTQLGKVLLTLQDWKPGKQNGHPIDINVVLDFIITNGKIEFYR